MSLSHAGNAGKHSFTERGNEVAKSEYDLARERVEEEVPRHIAAWADAIGLNSHGCTRCSIPQGCDRGVARLHASTYSYTGPLALEYRAKSILGSC